MRAAFFLALCACVSRGAPDADAGCPDVKLIEALHAATFWFERGSDGVGRAQLQIARELAGSTHDATVTEVLGRLTAFEADATRDRSKLELNRVAFRDWKCLPEPLHQQLHTALPPVE